MKRIPCQLAAAQLRGILAYTFTRAMLHESHPHFMPNSEGFTVMKILSIKGTFMKSVFCIMACIGLCAVVAGCEEGKTDPSVLAGQPGQAEQSEQSARWMTQGFAISEKEEKDEELNVRQYVLWERDGALDAQEGKYISIVDFGSLGELIWRLSSVTERGGRLEWVLEIQNAFTEESVVKKFSCEELGLENAAGRLTGMDLIDKDQYVFQWVEEEHDDQGLVTCWTADRRIYTDFLGELYSVDLWPAYLEAGLAEEGVNAHSLLRRGGCDGKGNTYVLASREKAGYTSVHLFDRSGKMILEYRGEQFQSVNEPLRTGEGELVFPVWDSRNRQYEYLWADTEGGEMRSLARGDTFTQSIFQMYGMRGDDIYYNRANKEIVKWNIENGSRTRVLDLPKNGLAAGMQIQMALGKEWNQPILCLMDTSHGKEWLVPLTDEEIPEQEIVRLAALVKSPYSAETPVADSVSTAASDNRDFLYRYEDDTTEESRTRVLADLSSGNGPDLMYVSLEDMRILEEKGALLDMGELLPEARVQEMLPGAVEIGTVNGKLVGIPVNVQAGTLMVSRDTWSKDSWTLEDLIDLMESGELEGGIFHGMGGQQNIHYFYPVGTMNCLLEYSLADSFLIDWEKRESHFDDGRFLRLLELTYQNLNDGPVETETWLNGGKRISWHQVGHGLNDGSFDVGREQENGHYVGFPTSGDCGNYLTTEGVIVVNAATKNKEAVRAYLETFCSREFQSDLREAGVFGYDPSTGFLDESSGKLMWTPVDEIAVFPDNTTSVDRVNLFLRECVAAPPTYPALKEIIFEELTVMYDQNRDPGEVAKIINNRVQMYLDEGQ